MSLPLEASSSLDELAARVRRHPRLFVLTGAGCSTGSGIPGYRDEDGAWKNRPPVQFADFVARPEARRRYWSRSLVGWPRVASAQPNGAHLALSALEQSGFVRALVTQNVDGLHQRAGSRRTIDLHGRLDEVECLECGARVSRQDVQEMLVAWNPGFAAGAEPSPRPDGDAAVEGDLSGFCVPDCAACGGILKPSVVFFGENVPRQRVADALAALAASDALLVVGSSLMVFSGYRFCLAARDMGKPLFAVNRGRTRADELFEVKVGDECAAVLSALGARLG